MKNRSIIFTAPNTAELISSEVPDISDTQVLIRIHRTAISAGTERAGITGDLNISIKEKSEVAHFPRYAGYSCSGTVERVGAKVTSLKVGDRVAASWSLHKDYHACEEKKAYKLPSGVSLDAGALIHVATFPAAAIRKCRLEFGESALVMGLGILGMIAVKLLRAIGASPIIAVDPVKEKRELALSHGADFALDPFDADFAKRVREITDGGVNVAIEVTGNGRGLDGALDCMKPYGRVALLGCTRNSDFSIDYYRKVHGPGITLVGAHTNARPDFESSPGWWTSWDDTEALIKLMLTKRIDLLSLVAETHSPEKAQEIYTRLANEPTFPVVQFDWSDI